MSVKSSRGLALAALVMAVPLLGPSAANAAMGGANAGTTTLRPDLRSAAVTNVNDIDVTTTVQFCFDKTINSLPAPGLLGVGDYNRSYVAANSASRNAIKANCADAVFSSTDIDSKQRTYASANSGAVTNSINGFGNIQDSTALIGSSTNNGTRGHYTGADLDGITVNNSTRTINYIFDQNVTTAVNTAAGNWQYIDKFGNVCDNTNDPTTFKIAKNVVSVTFPLVCVAPIADAVRATVRFLSVQALVNGQYNQGNDAAARPGTGGITNRPDLVSASVSASGTTATFTYDELLQPYPVPPAVVPPSGFYIDTSNNNFVNCTTPVVVNGNSVSCTLPGGSSFNEFDVKAEADPGAATALLAPNLTSARDAAPVGGNAGAFATGFTTAPEALQVTFDNATGVASVLLDQRFNTPDFSRFVLVDDAGAQIAASPISVAGAGGTAGQQLAKIQYTPSQLTGARSLLIGDSAVKSNLGVNNVDQIISPTATAAVLQKGSKVKFRHATRISRKQARAIRRLAAHRAVRRLAAHRR